jgi:hypothetical protein
MGYTNRAADLFSKAARDPLRKSWTFHSASAAKGCRGRKTLAYGWFRILESFRLGGRTKSDDVSTIDDWRLWTIGFVTEVRIESEPQINYRGGSTISVGAMSGISA